VQSAVLQSHVVCPSVRLSVTLVDCDHIGWNSSKIISRLVSLGCSLSTDLNTMDLLQGEQPEIWAQSDPLPVDLSVGDIRSQIAAEWLQIAQWSQWTAYRKPPSLFRMVPSLTPTTSPSPKWGVSYAPMIYANGYIAATSDPIHFMFGSGVGFSRSVDRMALFRVISNPRWRPAAILENLNGSIAAKGHAIHFMLKFYGRVFRAPILYSAHRAVIFAIAQLSCTRESAVSQYGRLS